jgi:hypothetical protein
VSAGLCRAGIDRCDVVVAARAAVLLGLELRTVAAVQLGLEPRTVAAVQLGLELRTVAAVKPDPAAQHRHLHRLVKVADTPSRFPRRPGVARKHPLGR